MDRQGLGEGGFGCQGPYDNTLLFAVFDHDLRNLQMVLKQTMLLLMGWSQMGCANSKLGVFLAYDVFFIDF